MASTGAHKGVVVSTAPFQSGALKFAWSNGIALVTITEGRFTFEARSSGSLPALSRPQASDVYGLPVFVAHCYRAAESGDGLQITVVSGQPQYAAELLLGVVS